MTQLYVWLLARASTLIGSSTVSSHGAACGGFGCGRAGRCSCDFRGPKQFRCTPSARSSGTACHKLWSFRRRQQPLWPLLRCGWRCFAGSRSCRDQTRREQGTRCWGHSSPRRPAWVSQVPHVWGRHWWIHVTIHSRTSRHHLDFQGSDQVRDANRRLCHHEQGWELVLLQEEGAVHCFGQAAAQDEDWELQDLPLEEGWHCYLHASSWWSVPREGEQGSCSGEWPTFHYQGQPSAVWAQVDEVPHEVLCILAMTSASLLLSALSKMVDLGRVHASLNGEVFEGTWSWFKISRSLTSAAVEICIHHPSPDSLRKQIHWPPSSSKPAAWPSWMSPISLHCHSQTWTSWCQWKRWTSTPSKSTPQGLWRPAKFRESKCFFLPCSWRFLLAAISFDYWQKVLLIEEPQRGAPQTQWSLIVQCQIWSW